METPKGYALLDFGHGERLEQWAQFRLIRPDPTALGAPAHAELWQTAHARYEGQKGQGEWVQMQPVPEHWPTQFDDLQMHTRLAPYKHTGVFPEQQQNWQWMRAQAKKSGRTLNILNLFAYTGGATMALAKDGHTVTHVDSSKPTIGWAKENAQLNNLAFETTRWILEDVPTFVERETKRGKKYDAILLDPPAYGHGQTGKTWRVERDLSPLLELCAGLLTEAPSFLVLNGYAHQDTVESFQRLLTGILRTHTPHAKFLFQGGDLSLQTPAGKKLSTGVVLRCAFGV